MFRLFLLIMAFNHAVFALPHAVERADELDLLIELLERTVKEKEVEQIVESTDDDGLRELNVTAMPTFQTNTAGNGHSYKAVDGKYEDSSMVGKDGKPGSCTMTKPVSNPHWHLSFEGTFCIGKVSILNRGDGQSEFLEGAMVQLEMEYPVRARAATCGSPVTEAQAAVPGGTVEFVCNPPVRSRLVKISIPSSEAVLQMCEVRVWELPMDRCTAGWEGSREVNIIDTNGSYQSSVLPGMSVRTEAWKPVDGRFNDSRMYGDDGTMATGSCTTTQPEDDPWYVVRFPDVHCISKVTILNRGDGQSDLLTGAVVRTGIVHNGLDRHRDWVGLNNLCGSPVSAEEAAEPGATISFECDPPMKDISVTIGIPSPNVTLQLCEVRLWEVSMDVCENGFKGLREINFVGMDSVGQGVVGGSPSEHYPMKVVDGKYNDSRMYGDDETVDTGSCARTGRGADPWWGMQLHAEYCIGRVSVLNRGDGDSELLTGAVVRIGLEVNVSLSANAACGSPVTADQAAVPGASVVFDCDPPVKARFVIVGIPSPNATLQLCEVRVWELPFVDCEKGGDDCFGNPCENGATCVDGINEFSCTCAAGFTGPLCETAIDECSSDPCMNGATCVDGINEVSCTCAAGFTGPLCETDIDECSSDPCMNGATCVDGINEVSCTCAAGFTGPLCKIAVQEPVSNPCDSNPCQNGICKQEEKSFICDCSPGYGGTLCQSAINSNGCTKDPCKNGICINYGEDGFKCVCSPGYEGTLCEINIDDCQSDPCQNGGQCVDEVNEVSCTCAEGFTGHLCEMADETEASLMKVDLTDVYCIKKVVVKKRGDCTSDRLTGAVVRAGTSSTGLDSGTCGSALTAEEALQRRAAVDFVCDPPVTAKFVTVDIPLLRVTKEQFCEITVEQASLGPC